jgi:hypothetical protein
MATITLDSRYSRADIKLDENGVKYIDWFGDIKFDISGFDDNIQYEVKPADTVFSIASDHYGSQRYYWVVCRANVIFNPFKKLVAGTKYILPSEKTFRTKILRVD